MNIDQKKSTFLQQTQKTKKGGSFKDNSTKTPTAESQTQCINIFIIPKKKKKCKQNPAIANNFKNSTKGKGNVWFSLISLQKIE